MRSIGGDFFKRGKSGERGINRDTFAKPLGERALDRGCDCIVGHGSERHERLDLRDICLCFSTVRTSVFMATSLRLRFSNSAPVSK